MVQQESLKSCYGFKFCDSSQEKARENVSSALLGKPSLSGLAGHGTNVMYFYLVTYFMTAMVYQYDSFVMIFKIFLNQ